MTNTKVVETIVVEEVRDGGLKGNGDWYKVSKYSAFKEFEVGKSYTVETELYEYNGFLNKRILRLAPK